jgi:hypothetical protein
MTSSALACDIGALQDAIAMAAALRTTEQRTHFETDIDTPVQHRQLRPVPSMANTTFE